MRNQKTGALMNSWICPVKPKSWKIIKKRGVFGAGRKVIMQQLRIGDILYFHAFRPVNGIVGKARVSSELFKDNRDIWGKDLYRYRVKIEVLDDLLAKKRQPFQLSTFFDKVIDQEITVEPYLRNVSIVKISDDQSKLLLKFFEAQK